jgi:signal transduction histidine kinase
MWLALLPMTILGVAIGLWAGADAVPGVTTLVLLMLSALGGLWFPVQIMPDVMQTIAKDCRHGAAHALGVHRRLRWSAGRYGPGLGLGVDELRRLCRGDDRCPHPVAAGPPGHRGLRGAAGDHGAAVGAVDLGLRRADRRRGLAMGAGLEAVRVGAKLSRAEQRISTLAVVAERERISRDLHDILGHSLTAISIKSELAGRLVSSDPPGARCATTCPRR